MTLRVVDIDEPAVPETHQDSVFRIFRQEADRVDIEIVPKETTVRNHRYCVSEVSFQKIEADTGLVCQVDNLPECTRDPILAVTGSVDNVLDLNETERIFYRLNGGSDVETCTDCPTIDPAIGFDVDLAECDGVFTDNTLQVTVADDADPSRICSAQDTVRFDGTAPVLSGCDDLEVEGDPEQMGAVVDFDVTAADACDGDVPADCDPPSGSFFPEGDTTVACGAGDGCGNQGQCSFTVSVAFCQDPDPRTQGYWHRQCLGMAVDDPQCPGIDPARNSRGVQVPNDPGFCPDYHDCAQQRLADLGFSGLTTCEGMDAVPPSDKCEKAQKQLTALILNVCSGRLTNTCEVDPAVTGCGSSRVGDLIDEIVQLIDDGDCKMANDCAAAVNEGDALVSDGGGA